MGTAQLELLANSLTRTKNPSDSKVQAMILYLPQENKYTGQLEFTPAVLYPDPSTERIFIASDAESGQAPTLPKSLSKLPGFSSAPDLLPGYPMIPFATDPGIGVVEEVMCDIRSKACALSVPLLSGPQTVGVLLVSPTPALNDDDDDALWTKRDKEQVSLAAQSLSMALTMDNERNFLRNQNDVIRENLSDSLHQMKNPIQALRTYGKILQRQVDMSAADVGGGGGGTSQLLDLAERLMVQSERVVDMMGPMDSLVETMDWSNYPVLLPAARSNYQNDQGAQSMVLWKDQQDDFNTSALYINDKEKFQSTIPFDDRGTEGDLSTTTVVGDFENELVFVTDLLDPIFDTFQAIASEQGISFEVVIEDADDLPGVFVSPKSFQEAISNVLDNALKYVVLPKTGSSYTNNRSPQVRVRIFPNDNDDDDDTASQDPGVTILVEDNGPGIAEKDRDLIFVRGFRSDTTNIVGGKGIGLDISQALMTRMGGYIGLANGNDILRDSLDGAVYPIIAIAIAIA
jgi:signal transduction histidine kinase